jgi:uncharacterized membrane protein
MNLRFYVICIAVLLALGVFVSLTLGVPFLVDSNVTATVHGATYAGDTLDPLNDTVISINSNPPQSIVAKNGTYSFELVPGDYIIAARCYRNNTLIYSKETTLKIEDKGNYVFDLLLYPVSKNQVTETADRVNNLDIAGPTGQTRNDSSTKRYLPVAFTLFFLLSGGYKLSRAHKKMQGNKFQNGKFNMPGLLVKIFGKSTDSGVGPNLGNIGEEGFVKAPITESAENSETKVAALKKLPLSSDLREVLDVIRGHKGRITQKDLRSRLEYSEVKVSLMLSELGKRGLIRKFKNGRENIVVLVDEKY